MKRSFTTLTDATLITAVVQHGYGEVITEALLEVGIQGSTVHAAMGVGIRERLGALGVAVDAERDVVNVMVSSDEVDRVFERVFLAGKLDTPGMGFMYATPLMQAATYVPPSILSRYASA
jgi:Nitrogen regulatory protein PII